MRQRKVTISYTAFKIMIMAVVDVYKTETLVDLYGNKKGLDYIIDLAFPSQKVKRKYSEAKPGKGTDFDGCFNFKNLGDFHSHTDYQGTATNTNPGPGDLEYLRINPGKISIIASVKKSSSKYEGWHHDVTTDSIIGLWDTWKGKLKIRLRGYYYDKRKNNYPCLELDLTKDLKDYFKEESLFPLKKKSDGGK